MATDGYKSTFIATDKAADLLTSRDHSILINNPPVLHPSAARVKR